jgi:archaemetzincin
VFLFASPGTEAKTVDEHIFFVPAGDIDKKTLQAVKEALPESLPMVARIEILPAEKIPEAAHNTSRSQHDAEAILDDISSRLKIAVGNESALIITDVDLYSRDLNFVFGVADTPRAAAIMSLARLKNEFYGLPADRRLFIERAVKEALHELGHAWGIKHCSNPKCVMYFSNTLQDTDRKRARFCHECSKTLGRRYSTPFFGGLDIF